MDVAWPPTVTIVRAVLRLAIVNGLMLWGLVWAAQRIDWPEAWWCIGLLFGGLTISIIYLWRINPELVSARRRFGPGTKRWDYAIFAVLVLGTTALLHVAGFAVRLGWPRFPVGVEVAGNVLMLLGIAGATWAQSVNRHFESSVRIQSDRGHAVVDTGPYAIVRHPGYVAGSLILIGMALALGSAQALIPAAAVIASLALRTVLEEQALRTDLPGYGDYMQRVKFRWVPGVW